MKKLHKKRKAFELSRSRKATRLQKSRNRNFRRRRINQNPYLQAQKRNSISNKYIPTEKEIVLLHAPSNFALFSSTDDVIEFIGKLKNYKSLSNFVSRIVIDLHNVTSIDIGTINMLLSTVKELGLYGISVSGNLPEEKSCNSLILKSGYLEHMNQVSRSLKRSMSIHQSENMILMNGKDKTENADVGKCIKTAMKQIMGEEMHYPPIYGIVQEMNGNSVEHAYTNQKKHWLLGINCIENGSKMAFTFTDNGFGILGRLERKFARKMFETLKLTTDEAILRGVFDKKYNSRFKNQVNRNKGLPVIKKAQTDNRISNLRVIANNVYLQIGEGDSIALKNEFSGTFYYWEVESKHVDEWKK